MSDLIDIGNKFALLVGINQYIDQVISRLNFSVKDIREFYEIIVDPKKGKYSEASVKLLCDDCDDKPTRNSILSKLTNMARNANTEDSILFYFSGHGYEKDDKAFILCTDSYTNAIEETAIPMETVKRIMQDSLARIKILVIDACHSGAIKGVKNSGIMTKTLFEAFFPAPEGFVVLSSCKLGECSYEWEEKEHGVFSYYLLEGLRGAADKDADGLITITDAHKYTSDNVKRWAFKKGLEQNPTLEAKISGDIPLVSVGEILEKEEEAIEKSIVSWINLARRDLDSDGDARELLERICGSLLRYVKTNEVKSLESGGYEFPYGILRITYIGNGKRGVEVSFLYSEENRDKIDEIITFFSEKYRWDSLIYDVEKRIKFGNLAQKLQGSNFEIISYNPDSPKESITVATDSWLHTTTVFENKKDGSIVSVSTIGDYLERDFYSTLNPKNILEFLKNCLE
jgi:hypothetical protein